MTHIKVRRSRATTSHQLQIDHHHQTTTTGAPSVVIQPTGKGSHAQQKGISARYVINLGTLPANVFKRNNIHNKKYRQPKAHEIQVDEPHHYTHGYSSDTSSSEDSFCLQVKVRKQNRKTQNIPNTTHLLSNIAYRLKLHHTRNQYLHTRIDTSAEVNLMPVSVYRLIYQDQDLNKLTPCNLKIGTYITDMIRVIGTTIIYLIHPDSKQPIETTFHVTSNEGSVHLSCDASLNLRLIHSRPRLDYLPPQASLITSKEDHPRKTKLQIQVQKHEVITKPEDHHYHSNSNKSKQPTLIINQKQILQEYPNIFEGIGNFPGTPYHIQVDPAVPPKQTPCRPIPIHLKDAFQKEINQMLQASVLLPVNEATPWINSFILIKKRDNQGQIKLRILS